ncbi:MAG: AI-2E family transporter [Clostridia bacterium]|nr:AI-2E family transporter [Clostridia bacterium]
MKNEGNKHYSIKKPLILITYAILFYFVVHHFATFLGYIKSLLKILTPLFIGIAIAFIVNLFLRFYEKKIYNKILKDKEGVFKKLRRPVCVIFAYATFIGIIWIIVNFISPKIVESIRTFTNNVPAYINSISDYLYNFTYQYELSAEIINKMMENFGLIISNTSQFLNSFIPKVVDITKAITTSIIDIFIGCVFSVYILISKEKLIKIAKKVLYAHLEEEKAEKVRTVMRKSNKVLRSFVGGQLTEAVILGVLCYVGMNILKMPYAPLISVIIGLSSIVPVIGPFIGTVPSALLILLESPVMAIWFVLFVIVLQQVEGNVIYPRVVGSAVGLSGFWVLLAVTVGGGLFGILGILLGVPTMAVIYSMYGQYVNKKNEEKGIKIE